MHAPRPPILGPIFLVWGHVLHPRRRYRRRDFFVLDVPLRCCQIHVEVTGHQQRGPMGAVSNGRDDALYGRGVVQGQVAPHDEPSPPPQRQLEADNVGVVLLVYFDREARRVSRLTPFGMGGGTSCHIPLGPWGRRLQGIGAELSKPVVILRVLLNGRVS